VNNFHVSHNYIKQQQSSNPSPLPTLQKDSSLPNLPTKAYRFNGGSSISTIPNQRLNNSKSQYSISYNSMSSLDGDSLSLPGSFILRDVQNQQLKPSRIPLRTEADYSSTNHENIAQPLIRISDTKEVYKQAAHNILGSPNGLSQTYFTGLIRPPNHPPSSSSSNESYGSILPRNNGLVDKMAGTRIETCPTGDHSPLYQESNPESFSEKVEKKRTINALTNFEDKGFIWLDDKENALLDHEGHKSNLLKAKILNGKRLRNRRFVQSRFQFDTENLILEDQDEFLEGVEGIEASERRKRIREIEGIEGIEGDQYEEGSNAELSCTSRFELTSRAGGQDLRSAFKWTKGDTSCRSILKRTSRTRSEVCFDSIKKVTFQVNQGGVYKSTPKAKLRQVCWNLAFGPLLLNSVKQWKDGKKVSGCDSFTQKYQENKEIFTRYLIDSISEPLMRLCKEKTSIRTVKSKITEKGLKKRSLKIHGFIMDILDNLTASILSQPLPPFLCEFLASITENDAMFPNNHLTPFEIKRLEFTHYATTKNMTDGKSKMLIGSHLLLRILLCDIIMRPWEVLPELKNKKFESNRIRNLLSVASIMYHALMEIFNKDNRLLTENQKFIEPNGRLKPIKKLIMATDDDVLGDLGDGKSLTESNMNNDIAGGFYSRQYVKDFIENHRVLYKDIRESMENIIECMYQQIHRVYIESVTMKRELFGFGKEDPVVRRFQL